jgi:MoxR-like ATPase
MFNVVIDYPSAEEERRILVQTTGVEDPRIAVVATGEQIERLHAVVREVPAAENVIDFAARLVRATRPTGPASDAAPEFVRTWVRWGAGPRAGQSLLLGAKAPPRRFACGRPWKSACSKRASRLLLPAVTTYR